MMAKFSMSSLHFILLIIFTNYVKEYKCDTICKGFQSSIKMKILNKGFHRDLKFITTFDERNQIGLWPKDVCTLALQLHLPSDAYVNPDELHDLRRLKKVLACPFGEVDVEKPTHLSPPTRTYLYSPLNSSKITMTLPIHFRYQKPKPKGGYVKLRLRHPWVLLRCPDNIFKRCESVETIPAPCAPCSPNTCQWYNISIVSANKVHEVLIPVADLDTAPIILFLTILVLYAGSIYLLSCIISVKEANRRIANMR